MALNRTRLKPTPFKGKKHTRTKATDIPQSVKDEVFERDGHRCVWCGSLRGMPEAHYIPRTKGGLGIPQNILTLCRVGLDGQLSCHDEYDKGAKGQREIMTSFFRNYLMTYYADWEWSEDKLIYKK